MVNWMNEDGERVGIDGKTLKGTFDFFGVLGRTTLERKRGKKLMFR